MMSPPANTYSETWFELFLRDMPNDATARETDFVCRFLPKPLYRNVLDLCCGDGRHCELLEKNGYGVTGFDRDKHAIAEARRRCPASQFIEGDMRNLRTLEASFDAVICLWQSFGYFDDATNSDILGQPRDRLVSHGRLILDIYNPKYFRQHEGIRTFRRNQHEVTESRSLVGNRLTVELDYGPATPSDRFAWRLYEPEELSALASALGFNTVVCCENFNEDQKPSGSIPRMQLVFGVKPA